MRTSKRAEIDSKSECSIFTLETAPLPYTYTCMIRSTNGPDRMLLSMSIKWKWTHCAKALYFNPRHHRNSSEFAINHLEHRERICCAIIKLYRLIFPTPHFAYAYVNSHSHRRIHCTMSNAIYHCWKLLAFTVYALFVAATFALPIAFLNIFVLMVFTRKSGRCEWGSGNFQRRYFWTIDKSFLTYHFT